MAEEVKLDKLLYVVVSAAPSQSGLVYFSKTKPEPLDGSVLGTIAVINSEFGEDGRDYIMKRLENAAAMNPNFSR